eukprot:CAMPEP_0172810702 /NCGR_PEP_ID=MMETSP1075-20121228/8962_1 /TAXON_ID=2916 /ORGANISM="Ceratium fusus, Strain PA161109" /LENGTH=766 /DNA_ID=CAMNT_0013650047 /DNA_START=43 /DNA_END=2343 /DNA_ORIENTATION=+
MALASVRAAVHQPLPTLLSPPSRMVRGETAASPASKSVGCSATVSAFHPSNLVTKRTNSTASITSSCGLGALTSTSTCGGSASVSIATGGASTISSFCAAPLGGGSAAASVSIGTIGGGSSVSSSASVAGSASSAGGRGGGLKRLGTMAVPPWGFDPNAHLPELVRLLGQGMVLPRPQLRAVGVTGCVWILSGGPGLGDLWCLKHVSSLRRVANLPTDVQHCDALLLKFPTLLADKRLGFPHSVVHLQAEGEPAGDLLIARAMPGIQLAQHIAKLDKRKPGDHLALERISNHVGTHLGDFHRRYTDPMTGELARHSDFHPSNVLYDEETGTISFVDLTGMGTWGPNDDVSKFARLIRQLGSEHCEAAFTRSYHAAVSSLHAASSSTHRLSNRPSPPLIEAQRTPLYAATAGDQPPSKGSFRTMGFIFVPSSGFDPCAHLTTLSWMIAPGITNPRPSVRKLGVSGKVWLLNLGEQNETFVLKQVCARKTGTDEQLSEAERCERLARQFPDLLQDPRLALPHTIIPMQGSCEHIGDLLVMPALAGEPLSRYVATLNVENFQNQRKLEGICQEVGSLLADIHSRYTDPATGQPLQHRAFHMGNVLYDEATNSLGVIGFGDEIVADAGADVERFASAISKRAGDRYSSVFVNSYRDAAPHLVLDKKVEAEAPATLPITLASNGFVAPVLLPAHHCFHPLSLAKLVDLQPSLVYASSWWFCGADYSSDSDMEALSSSNAAKEPPDDAKRLDAQARSRKTKRQHQHSHCDLM